MWFGICNQAYYGIQIDSEKSIGSLEGSSTLGRLGLEGLFLFVYSNLSILTWRVAEKFFVKFFNFLFDNTSWFYFVFASLFPYSCALHLLFVVHVYALE